MTTAIEYLTNSIKSFCEMIQIINNNGFLKSTILLNDEKENQNKISV